MRVAGDHLVADLAHHRLKGEVTAFGTHGRMINGLQQQIAQLPLKIAPVLACDGVCDLIGLFDCVGGDAVEILLDVPRAARFRVTQAAHDRKQAFNSPIRVVDQVICHCSRSRFGVRCT